jgi:hypothetical protein
MFSMRNRLAVRESEYLKLNFIGIIGGILGFVSLALPWWTITASYGAFSTDISVYLYQATYLGRSMSIPNEFWYAWAALALVLVGSVLALTGSVITAKRRVLLSLGGVLVLVGVVLFPIALQLNIPNAAVLLGADAPPGLGVFSSGSYSLGPFSANYVTYLTLGFWIALVGCILMFVAASRKVPAEPTAPALVAESTPPLQPQTGT